MIRGWSVPAVGAANDLASIGFAGRRFGGPDGPRDCVGFLRGVLGIFFLCAGEPITKPERYIRT